MSEPMLSAMECARTYLAPPEQAFWRWSDDHSAVQWRDGQTILLCEEVLELLDSRLRQQRGLPPFQIVVALAALLRTRARLLVELADDTLPDVNHVWRRLQHLPAARARLYDWVLLALSDTRPAFAINVREALAAPLPDGHLAPRDVPCRSRADITTTLRTGLRGLTAARLELLARTGLQDVPDAAELDVPDGATAAQLLDSIADYEELAGVAHVARTARAAFRVPRLAARPEQLPRDGVAGLCTRGSLDRLALSELVHDDDVLAARIATNEALFVEREQPPSSPQHHRHILIDCGVRMWGQPRALGVAIALAIAAGPARSGARTDAQTLCGGALRPVDLTTRAGLLAQLERRDLSLDVCDALPAFFDRLRVHDDEAVLVVHHDTMEDPGFRAQLHRGHVRQFVVDVTGDGRARMWHVRPRGMHMLREATLDTRSLSRGETRTPSYYRRQPEPLPTRRRGSPPAVTALASQSGTLLLRNRRGRHFVLRVTRAGAASFENVEDVHRGSLLFLPRAPKLAGHPNVIRPAMQPLRPDITGGCPAGLFVAQLTGTLRAFWDGRLLHLLPDDRDVGELTLDLEKHNEVRAVDESSEHLRGERLVRRVQELLEACP